MLRKLYEFLMGPRKEDKPKEPPVKNKNLPLPVDAAKKRVVQKNATMTEQFEPLRFAGPPPRPARDEGLRALTVGERKYDLRFKKHRSVYRDIWQDMQDTTYQIGKRKYLGRKTFSEKKVESISNNEVIWEDAYHSKVLAVYEPVPTFDSADREWDSMKVDYLIFDGEHIDIVHCHYGYKMGSIDVYEQLYAADSDFRPWLERLGFPAEGIKWLDNSPSQ